MEAVVVTGRLAIVTTTESATTSAIAGIGGVLVRATEITRTGIVTGIEIVVTAIETELDVRRPKSGGNASAPARRRGSVATASAERGKGGSRRRVMSGLRKVPRRRLQRSKRRGSVLREAPVETGWVATTCSLASASSTRERKISCVGQYRGCSLTFRNPRSQRTASTS